MRSSRKPDLIVIQDELDFPLGTLRIHRKRSSAGHNGIESMIGALGTQDFLRIRHWGSAGTQDFGRHELLVKPVPESGIGSRRHSARYRGGSGESDFDGRRAAAMNRFNRKPEEPEED